MSLALMHERLAWRLGRRASIRYTSEEGATRWRVRVTIRLPGRRVAEGGGMIRATDLDNQWARERFVDELARATIRYAEDCMNRRLALPTSVDRRRRDGAVRRAQRDRMLQARQRFAYMPIEPRNFATGVV